MKDRHGQRLQNGRHSEKQKAAESAEPCTGPASDSGGTASRESNCQKSNAQRRHKRIQTEGCKPDGDSTREGAWLQGVSPADGQRIRRNAGETWRHVTIEHSHRWFVLCRRIDRRLASSHANLGRAALRAEGLAVLDDLPALVTGMVHGICEGLD
jgi:hypothetical protein